MKYITDIRLRFNLAEVSVIINQIRLTMPSLLSTNHQQTIKCIIAPLKRTRGFFFLEGLNLLVVRILSLITGCLICVTHFPHLTTRLCVTQTAERSSASCHGSTVTVTVMRTQAETVRP